MNGEGICDTGWVLGIDSWLGVLLATCVGDVVMRLSFGWDGSDTGSGFGFAFWRSLMVLASAGCGGELMALVLSVACLVMASNACWTSSIFAGRNCSSIATMR